jgi:hypothetical protein
VSNSLTDEFAKKNWFMATEEHNIYEEFNPYPANVENMVSS